MQVDFTDEFFMNLALQEAQIAYNDGEIPIGCVIVYQNRVISKAHNQVETLNDPTAHAEILAITSATEAVGSKYLDECTMYVTLEPCVMCAGALYWSQIGRLVYGANDSKRGFMSVSKSILHPKTTIKKNVLEHKCSTLLLDFFNSMRDLN